MTGLRKRVARGAAGPSAALLLLLSFGGPAARAEEGKSPGGEQPAPIQEELMITNQDTGETRTAVQLGGELGIRSVKGVKTRLYVLQAASPERFRTEGSPTHLFTVALSDEKKGGNIANASVTLAVKGPGKERSVALETYKEKFYRGQVRMAEAGKYTVEVRFKTPKRSGSASFPFEVVPPRGAPPPEGR